MLNRDKRPRRRRPTPDRAAGRPTRSDAPATVDPLSVEVGYALVSIVDEKQGGTLLNRVRAIRRQIATETGVVVPPVHVADNLQLGPRDLRDSRQGRRSRARRALRRIGCSPSIPGTADTRARRRRRRASRRSGCRRVWIASRSARRARSAAGYTVVDPTTALSTHLSETIRTFLPDLLSRQQTKELVDRVGQTSPKLVEELVPKLVSIGDVQRVLRQLLRERVPIRDLTTILEAMADAAAASKDPDAITEAVRTAHRPGDLPAVSERDVASCRASRWRRRSRSSSLASIVAHRAGRGAGARPAAGAAPGDAGRPRSSRGAVAQPVLLCSPTLRPHLWRLFARVLPHLGVVSHNEVPPQVQVAVGRDAGLICIVKRVIAANRARRAARGPRGARARRARALDRARAGAAAGAAGWARARSR